MKLRNIIFTGATATLLGLVGVTGYGEVRQAIDCVGKDVQIEYEGNHYCASTQDYTIDQGTSKDRIANDQNLIDEDLAFAQLLIHNDTEFKNDMSQIFLDKYVVGGSSLDGSKFNKGLPAQVMLMVEIADINCTGNCNLNPMDATNEIYQLLQR